MAGPIMRQNPFVFIIRITVGIFLLALTLVVTVLQALTIGQAAQHKATRCAGSGRGGGAA